MTRQAMPVKTVKDDDMAFNAIEPSATLGESVGASFDMAMDETFVMSLARKHAIEEAEGRGGKTLQPSEANQMYPNLPVPFREPVNAQAAMLIHDQNKKKGKLEQRIQAGPDSAFGSVARFGAGMVAHALDPVETGLGVATGFGVTAFAPKLMATATRAFGTNIGINLAENAISETLVKEAALMEQQNYTNADFMMNVAAGAFVMPLAGAAFKGVKYGLGKSAQFFSKQSPQVQAKTASYVVDSMMRGKRPDIGVIKKAILEETNYTKVDAESKGVKPYAFVPVKGQALEGKTYYVPTKEGSSAHLSDDIGGASQATDNLELANGKMAGSMGGPSGKVQEVVVKPGVKTIDLDDAVPTKLVYDKIDGLSIRDALEVLKEEIAEGRLPENAIDDFSTALRKEGYGAITSDGSKAFGENVNKHNELHILDDNAVEVRSEALAADPIRRDLNMDEYKTEGEDPFFTKEVLDDFRQNFLETEQKIESSVKQDEQEYKEMLDIINDEKAQKLYTPEELQELKVMETEIKDIDMQEKMAKSAIGCLWGA